MKRILAALLLLCMVIPLAACPASTGPSTGDGGGGGGGTDDVRWIDSVGEYDFGGADVEVSVFAPFEYEMFGAEGSQDTLDQLLWKRNQALKDRFNVNLVSVPTASVGANDQTSHIEYVRDSLQRGQAEFDLVAMYAYVSGKLIMQDNYLDWRNEVPYCGDSIKAAADWWPKETNINSTVCGHQYVAVSDLSITAIEMAWGIVFNKELVESNNIPQKLNAQTMYEIVDRGDWTLDNMYTLLNGIRFDGEGGTVGVADDTDTYGILMQGYTDVDAFAFAFGYNYIENDGYYEPMLWTLSDNTIIALEKLRDLSEADGSYFETDDDLRRQFFAGGQALFATFKLIDLKSDVFHEMEDPYGILPYPKLNKNQQKYMTGSEDHYSVFSIPYFCVGPDDPEGLERVGAVVEALSAYNNANVNDLYYEAIVTHRNTRDEDSIRMIDKIMEGRVYDLTTYHYDELVVDDVNNGSLGLFFRHVVTIDRNTDITAYYDKGKVSRLPRELANLIAEYKRIAEQ